MSIRILRKALGLLIVDIVIIIGIFVLQFRTDSSILEKIGTMQITLEQTENQQNAVVLKNKFLATYNGLSIFCDDQHPVVVVDANNGAQKNILLKEWKKNNDLSCSLFFTDNVVLTLSLSSASPTATLNTIANLPSNISDIYVPYSYSYNMKEQKNDGNRIVIDGKKNSWEIMAYNLANNQINLNERDRSASYSLFDATLKFTFEAVADLAIAEKEAYGETVNTFNTNLISAFKANNSESSLTEQTVISYIAAKAQRGEYSQAIEDIPAAFKKSKQRTYLSAPYLNTLETMNEQLEKEIMAAKVTMADAAYANSLDIFNSGNLAARMCISQSPKNVTRILEYAASADMAAATLSQVSGILKTYVELVEWKPEIAQVLEPALDGCITRITDACSFDGEVLTISENDTFLSVIQAVETGTAILRYGIYTGNDILIRAGRVLVNSYLAESSSFDLRTLSNLYPIVNYSNNYYPHYEQIETPDGRYVWAWTASNGITYEKDEADGSITITIDFPEGLTHYVILKGVPQFTSIYIYNMAFRTDPRFETYNSSGYVYKNEGGTLLLKSRHKTRFETVKLEYDEEVARRRAEEAEKAAQATKEESKEESESIDNDQLTMNNNTNAGSQTTSTPTIATEGSSPSETVNNTPAPVQNVPTGQMPPNPNIPPQYRR